MFFIYDKSSISVLFPQMTFVLNFVLNLYDLKEGYPSMVWRVTCPTAYFGLDLYLLMSLRGVAPERYDEAISPSYERLLRQGAARSET